MKQTAHDGSSPVQLNIELDGSFLLAMVERYGVIGWNRWIEAMTTSGLMPLAWGADEAIPPCWYWMDFSDSDFSMRSWDGINLGLPYLKNVNFNAASLVGARIGCSPFASFRGANLSGCDFRDGDITGCDFEDALMTGIKLDRAAYDSDRPPLGLSDELLRICKEEPRDEASGTGLAEIPLAINASLTALWMPR